MHFVVDCGVVHTIQQVSEKLAQYSMSVERMLYIYIPTVVWLVGHIILAGRKVQFRLHSMARWICIKGGDSYLQHPTYHRSSIRDYSGCGLSSVQKVWLFV